MRLTVQLTSSPTRPEYSEINGLPLGLAHLLQDHLLGGLRGDAAQRIGGLGEYEPRTPVGRPDRSRCARASEISFTGSWTDSTTFFTAVDFERTV